ncbi:uncharacterized protein LOC142606574 [Castanea sativa]|uniref:uncharacterized protein LOC142606574 n=1 Tax=Castanea sativa TaxID=21020 RepID=UPI003F64C189
MRKALLTKNKLGFIDGTLTLSTPLVSTPSAVQAWIRNHFAQTSGPRVFNLQKEIVELHQGEVSTTDFFTQLKVLWDQLQNLSPFPSCTCGKCVCNINKRLTDLQVKESVMRFLMGLNDSFSQVRTQVLLMDPIPSLSKVYSLLIQEQTQRSVTNTFVAKVDSTVLAAKMPNGHANLGTNLASTSSSGKGKDRPICTHCGKTGHIVDKCYKLHSFPLGFKFKNKPSMAHQVSSSPTLEFLPFASSLHHHSTFTPDQYQQLLALIGNSSYKVVSDSCCVEIRQIQSSRLQSNSVELFPKDDALCDSII